MSNSQSATPQKNNSINPASDKVLDANTVSPNAEQTPVVEQTASKKPVEKLKKNKAKTAPSAKKTPQSAPLSTPEFMANEYKGISIYAMAMIILIGFILWTGIATVQQVQAYHQQYGTLQQLKKDYRNLQIENQRLLIEQQTFSATPQIANRAVSELNMFYPQLSDRMIIQANTNPTSAMPAATSNTTTASATPSIKPTPSNATPHAQIQNNRVGSNTQPFAQSASQQGANP